MDDKDLIIKAFVMEAEQKPHERIYIGSKSYSYKEFASMLNGKKKLDELTSRVVEDFISKAVKLFNENEEFRKKIMLMAGALK